MKIFEQEVEISKFNNNESSKTSLFIRQSQ